MTLVEPRWDDARSALAAAARPRPAARVGVADCDGLVLAEDLRALIPLPAFDTSAMDGWAVAGAGPWSVTGAALAGRDRELHLLPGQAVVIATGGVVPASADAVIRSEEGSVTQIGEQAVLAALAPVTRSHVRPAGEECRAGEVLAAKGQTLNPALMGLAAAAGHDDLVVIPRPRAALVLFGDELTTRGVPTPGLVRDSLGPQIPAWLARMGVDVVAVERARDTLDAHVSAIRAAAAADVIFTTGGTAAGPADHLHAAVIACAGELLIDRVAVRPGHPMLAGRVHDGSTWLVGLPGNPQSAVVTLLSLGGPILAGLAGRSVPDLAWVTAAHTVGAPPREDRLVLGTVRDGAFHPGGHLGSGMLRGLAGATGFAVVPPGGAQAGAGVRWLALPA